MLEIKGLEDVNFTVANPYYKPPKTEQDRARLQRLLREWNAMLNITRETPNVLRNRLGIETKYTLEELYWIKLAQAHVAALKAALGEPD